MSTSGSWCQRQAGKGLGLELGRGHKEIRDTSSWTSSFKKTTTTILTEATPSRPCLPSPRGPAEWLVHTYTWASAAWWSEWFLCGCPQDTDSFLSRCLSAQFSGLEETWAGDGEHLFLPQTCIECYHISGSCPDSWGSARNKTDKQELPSGSWCCNGRGAHSLWRMNSSFRGDALRTLT